MYTWNAMRTDPTDVVSSGNSQTGDKIVNNGPDGGLGVPVYVEDTVDGQGRSDSQGEERNPSERVAIYQYKQHNIEARSSTH